MLFRQGVRAARRAGCELKWGKVWASVDAKRSTSDDHQAEQTDAEVQDSRRPRQWAEALTQLESVVQKRPEKDTFKALRLLQENTRFSTILEHSIRRSVRHVGLSVRTLRNIRMEARLERKKEKRDTFETPRPVYNQQLASQQAMERSPAHISIAVRVLRELHLLRPHFRPRSMLDFGSGVGCSTIAAATVFHDPKSRARKDEEEENPVAGTTLRRVTCVERSDGMIDVGRELLNELFRPEDLQSAANDQKMASVTWRRGVRDLSARSSYELVVASMAFGEIGGGIKTLHAAVNALWSLTERFMVVIDEGTIEGFARVRRVRDMFISPEHTEGPTGSLFHDTDEPLFIENGRIVAPCLHARRCPMTGRKQSCVFRQAHELPSFTRELLGRRSNVQRTFFSYLVLEKVSEAERAARDGDSLPRSSARRPAFANEHMRYGRLVRTPLKRGQHVHVDVCNRSGELERLTVAHSHGKVPYRLARKSELGDVWMLPKFERDSTGSVPPRHARIWHLRRRRQLLSHDEEIDAWR